MDPSEQQQWKKAAAEAAAKLVEDGMVVGLGTGSTAALFVSALGRRVTDEHLRISGIPTSEQNGGAGARLEDSPDQFRRAPANRSDRGRRGRNRNRHALSDQRPRRRAAARENSGGGEQAHGRDRGRDEVGRAARLAVACARRGGRSSDGRPRRNASSELGGNPTLRPGKDGKPCVTDGGNYIIDCAFGPMENPKEIAHHLDHVVGSVEHGMFLEFASEVIVGGRDGVTVLRKTNG